VTDPLAWIFYGIAWIAYGLVHSILAAKPIKTRLAPVFGAGYRLAYNIFALIGLIAVLAIGHMTFDATPFQLSNGQKIILSALAIAGWGIMFLALRQYDLGLFAGTKQLRAARKGEITDEAEPLTTKGMNRFVRHPLYSGAFLALWGAAWTPLGLATAIFASAYLIIGSRYEERRLSAQYGAAYESYQTQVPAFIPWRRPKI
jgi:protein-S-isoprenylcysteine O-methyltransferase Ste14